MTYKYAAVTTLAAMLMVPLASSADTIEAVEKGAKTMLGEQAVRSIKPTAVDDIYQLDVRGKLQYAQKTGNHILIGNFYDIEKRIDIGRAALQDKNKDLLNGLDESEMITFGDKDAKRTITVFTDIDCGYCAKLHKEVPKLTEAGVKVRYMFYPRSGLGKASYNKAVSVWCADDQQTAMNQAKNDRKITPKTCENPVESQYKMGREFGLRGTPMIVVDDGRTINGYMPAERLLTTLGLAASK